MVVLGDEADPWHKVTNGPKDENRPKKTRDDDADAHGDSSSERVRRWRDDRFSKHSNANYLTGGGSESPAKLAERQGKQATYLPRRKTRISRWLAWTPMTKR